MDQSYFEELIVLTIVGVLLLIAKLTACCFSLGLHQNHKAINVRQDSLSIAKLNHLQLERVSEEKREETVTCSCKSLAKSPSNPQRSPTALPRILPKLESTTPCLEIPEKILVCGRIQAADTPSMN